MNLTSFNSNTNVFQSLTITNLPNTLKHDLLVITGLLVIIFLLFLLLCQCICKLHRIYQTSEPILPEYHSYEKLAYSDDNLCQCLPKFECVKMNCQISHRCVNYEQINERQKPNSISRVYLPHHSQCIHIHTVK